MHKCMSEGVCMCGGQGRRGEGRESEGEQER